MDEWGQGKAFHCDAAKCGADAQLYVRAKVGFCNCTSGVADDLELDRVSDFDLVGGELTPLGEGHPATVAWMKGRGRAFVIKAMPLRGRGALSVAFNDRCDVIVATVVAPRNKLAFVETGALDFLSSATMRAWARRSLGLAEGG